MAAGSDERELVVTRVVDAPRRLVFKTWTQPEHVARWWGPQGFTTIHCDMDVRVGGGYRLVFRHQGGEMAFFGTYREVVPDSRIVWTNDESGEAGQLSTVTFEDKAGKTLVVMSELYPTKDALDAAIEIFEVGEHLFVPQAARLEVAQEVIVRADEFPAEVRCDVRALAWLTLWFESSLWFRDMWIGVDHANADTGRGHGFARLRAQSGGWGRGRARSGRRRSRARFDACR